MPTERSYEPGAASKSARVDVTPEDLDRFRDEEQVRDAWDERRLRDELPPHHQ